MYLIVNTIPFSVGSARGERLPWKSGHTCISFVRYDTFCRFFCSAITYNSSDKYCWMCLEQVTFIYISSQSLFDELTCYRLKSSGFPASRDAYRWRDRVVFQWHSDLPHWARNQAPSRCSTGPKHHLRISCSRSLSYGMSKYHKSKLEIIRKFTLIFFSFLIITTHIINSILRTQSVGKIRGHIWRVTSDHAETTGVCIDQRDPNRCTLQ